MNTHFFIDNIPVALYGDPSDRVFLYLHGQGGNKEEALRFQKVAGEFGYRTLAMDLPEHGERRDGRKLLPWETIPEIRKVYHFAKERFSTVSLRTVSIGTWLASLACQGESSIPACFLHRFLTWKT